MPFIGNQLAQSYISFAKQDFTTSATTSYTLDQPVANANELALFINFVRQEPTTAYTASGTTLTLTSATSASDDMYCVFLGKAVQTVNPPSGSVDSSKINYPLTTFSSTGIDDNATSTAITIDSSQRVGIGETSPLGKLHVSTSGALTTTALLERITTITNSPAVSLRLLTTSTGDMATDFGGGITFNLRDNADVINPVGAIFVRRDGEDNSGKYEFATYNSGSLTTVLTISKTGAVNIPGSLSKGSGSFKINHPLPEKKDTHYLVHSFTESPQADLLYRGKITLINGTATVNIDTVAGMTEGTFVLLNREVQCFTTNETGWSPVKGSVSGNTLTITAQDNNCNDIISWLVIGERQDQHMYDTEWTDEDGKVIVEPLKEARITQLENA